MAKSTQVLLYALLLIAGLAIANWFYNNFTWVKEETDVGFQGIAQSNQLLAAEFFLRNMGIRAHQVNGLVAFRNLPSPRKTILIATPRETLNEELSQDLLSWVRSGGHLIVEARVQSANADNKQANNNNDLTAHARDSLLSGLSVFSVRSNTDADNKNIPVAFFLDSPGQSQEIQVDFPYYRILSRGNPREKQPESRHLPEPVWVVEDELGAYLMQFSLEQGLLTVLTSSRMFTNEQIDKYDHARFLHFLLQHPGYDDGVWLIRVDDMPALWRWLWDNARYTMLCLMILLLLWLWRAPLRFGPQLNDAPTRRRSLLEHIQASGYYRWHEQQSGLLLAKVQERVWENIQRLHPGVRRENAAQAFTMLEEITGIQANVIKQALTPVLKLDEQEFTEKVRILEAIREQL